MKGKKTYLCNKKDDKCPPYCRHSVPHINYGRLVIGGKEYYPCEMPCNIRKKNPVLCVEVKNEKRILDSVVKYFIIVKSILISIYRKMGRR